MIVVQPIHVQQKTGAKFLLRRTSAAAKNVDDDFAPVCYTIYGKFIFMEHLYERK